MGFQQGLSGLNASSKNLDVIGHNIANSGTVGFKASRTEFAAMVANAIGRCEVRVFRGGEETQDREYYMWNYEPNLNENSTMFWHKAVGKLYTDNEALIVSSRRRDTGTDAVLVADIDDGADVRAHPRRAALIVRAEHQRRRNHPVRDRRKAIGGHHPVVQRPDLCPRLVQCAEMLGNIRKVAAGHADLEDFFASGNIG